MLFQNIRKNHHFNFSSQILQPGKHHRLASLGEDFLDFGYHSADFNYPAIAIGDNVFYLGYSAFNVDLPLKIFEWVVGNEQAQ